MSDENPNIVKVFVRKGATDNERVISFARPAMIPWRTWMEHDFAVDGNQVCRSVVPANGETRSGALLDAERDLVLLLREFGLGVDFV